MIVLSQFHLGLLINNYYIHRGGEISIQIYGNGIKESMTEISTNSGEAFSSDLINSGHEKEDVITSENIEVELKMLFYLSIILSQCNNILCKYNEFYFKRNCKVYEYRVFSITSACFIRIQKCYK